MAQDILLSLNVPVKCSSNNFLLLDGFEGVELIGFGRLFDNKNLAESTFSNFFVKLKRRQCDRFGLVVDDKLVHFEDIFASVLSCGFDFFL